MSVGAGCGGEFTAAIAGQARSHDDRHYPSVCMQTYTRIQTTHP